LGGMDYIEGMNKITPLFKTSFSVTRSIFTSEVLGKSKPDGAPSIVDVAKREGLEHVICVENSVGGYMQAKNNLEKEGIGYSLGWILNMTSDLSDETGSSLHKIVVFAKNDDGWKDFIKLHNLASTKLIGKFGPQITGEILQDVWSDNLLLAVPMYDSYLFNNLLTVKKCILDIGKIKPTYFSENNDLPFDHIINDKLNELEDIEILKTKSIYYENRADFDAYLTLRLLNRKSYGSNNTLEQPNMEFMSSREFCVESWREQNNE
jgi:DNA polymerase III alpha subunit